jgi:antitoxin CcdA
MITYKTQLKEEMVMEKVTCDVCKRRYDYNKDVWEAQEFQHIRIEGGYGSVFGDGNKLKADICQDCYKEIIGKYLVEDND